MSVLAVDACEPSQYIMLQLIFSMTVSTLSSLTPLHVSDVTSLEPVTWPTTHKQQVAC
jgi:hypothetical protein